MVVHIGVTGTRGVLSDRQETWLKDEMVMLDLSVRLVRLQRPVLHHGDCVGTDTVGHELARALGWDIEVHPPLNGKYRAYCKGASKTHEERRYLARDRLIVRACSTILGVPGTAWGEADGGRKSGTWYTIEQAMRAGKEVKICGSIVV